MATVAAEEEKGDYYTKAPLYDSSVEEQVVPLLATINRSIPRWATVQGDAPATAVVVNNARALGFRDGIQVWYDTSAFFGEVKQAALDALVQSTPARWTLIVNDDKAVLSLFKPYAPPVTQYTDLEIGTDERKGYETRMRQERARHAELRALAVTLVLLLFASTLVFVMLWVFGPPSGHVESHFLGGAAGDTAQQQAGAIVALDAGGS